MDTYPKDLDELDKVLRGRPEDVGLPPGMWDGPTLSTYLQKHLGVSLKVRQCQRLFRHLGFRLRKPRPAVASEYPAEPDAAAD